MAREKHCRFPHCERPAKWCEARHANPFAAGGNTGVNEGLLLRRWHHHLIHEGGCQPVRDCDGYRAIPPPDHDWMLPPSAAA